MDSGVLPAIEDNRDDLAFVMAIGRKWLTEERGNLVSLLQVSTLLGSVLRTSFYKVTK